MTSITLTLTHPPPHQLTQVELLPPLPLSPVSEQHCTSLTTTAYFYSYCDSRKMTPRAPLNS
jgi:hypothetical protein